MKQNPAGRETVRYWIIAPMEAAVPNLFSTAWEYDKQHGTIAIGWCCDSAVLQDASQFTNVQELQAEIRKHKPNWGAAVGKIIWDFHCNMQVGDIVIARRGYSEILGIGTLTKTAYYDLTKGIKRIGVPSPPPKELQPYLKPRFVEVFWAITGNFSVSLKPKPNKIIQKIPESRYQKILLLLKEAFKDIPNPNIHQTMEKESEIAHQGHEPEHNRIWNQRPKSSNLPKSNYYIGIDLGTTNSVMAWGDINRRTNQFEPKIVPINMMTEYYATEKKVLLPSCVYFEEGQPPNVGEYAKKMLEVQPDRVIESVKHQIGTENKFEIDGTPYTAPQILALILIHLAASAKSHFGFIPDNAVITVPAYFNIKMREAIVKAAKLAGFRTTDDNGNSRAILVDEPYAILYNRINQEIRGEVEATIINSRDPKLVLTFDLGGGALEVSLHQVSHQKDQDTPNIDPIARSYNIQVGGNHFDELLADYFRKVYREKFKLKLDNFQTYLLRNIFRQYAEQAKLDLSKRIEFEKNLKIWNSDAPPDTFTIPTIIRKPFWNKEFRYEQFSLAKYEQIIEPFLASHLTLDAVNQFDTMDLEKNNIIYPILDVLRKGKDRIGVFPQVDVVLLNGGMTKLHTIQRRLETLFGFSPLEMSGDGVVARGASIFHYNSKHQGFKPPPRILMETIMIGIARNKPINIKAGTHLPTALSKFFDWTVKVGKTSERLTVVYRSNPNSSKQFQSQVQEFQFGRPLEKEDIPISVRMKIDEQGILNIEGHPKNNPDEKFTVTVNLETSVQENSTQRNTDGLRHLDIESEMEELTINFSQLMLTNNLDVRRQILSRIEAQESRIAQSANAEKFVAPLCERVNSFHNPLDDLGKMLAMNMLGHLATQCSDTDLLHDICEVAIKLISSKEIKTNGRTYVNSVVRYTVETIGKIGLSVETIGKTSLSIAKSSLFHLLHLDETDEIRPTVIYSIGKCCDSMDAIEYLISFTENNENNGDADRIAANWALGRIGRREKEKPLPIQQLREFIPSLIEQLKEGCHNDIKRNSIYALAEICDRRKRKNDDIVSPETAAKVILLLVTFLTNQMRDNLSDSTPPKSSTKLQEAALLAIQMIRGVDLSPDEKESLHAIREEN